MSEACPSLTSAAKAGEHGETLIAAPKACPERSRRALRHPKAGFGPCKQLISQGPAPEGNDLRAMPSPGRAIGGLLPCRYPIFKLLRCSVAAGGTGLLGRLWFDEEGQDIAEYAVMLSVILAIVVGTIRLIGSNANTVFSSVASSIQ